MAKDKLLSAVMKKAVGYNVNEVVEEYSEADGELKLVKRKVTTKHVPPDVAAAKVVMELNKEKGLAEMTEAELIKEREMIIAELKAAGVELDVKISGKKT